ncbi:MAG TPA: hypothetical protein VF760_12020, partial [Xanthobacteraceae bacterium]
PRTGRGKTRPDKNGDRLICPYFGRANRGIRADAPVSFRASPWQDLACRNKLRNRVVWRTKAH